MYNPLGLKESETKTIDGDSHKTSYTYNRQANITNIKNPDNSEVSYALNTAGLLETIRKKELIGTWENIVTDFDYSPLGQVVFTQYANSVSTTNTYDANKLYRLSNKETLQGQNIWQNLTYTYDKVGNIIRLDDNSATETNKVVEYTYDDLNRLIIASTTIATSTPNHKVYDYDILGNILEVTDTSANPFVVMPSIIATSTTRAVARRVCSSTGGSSCMDRSSS